MKESPNERIAVATLLTAPSYVEGALVLGHSLQKIGWPHETLLMTNSVISISDREKLKKFWSRIVDVEPIANPNAPEKMGFSYYDCLYTKLRIWEQTDYSKIIYIDSDAVVLGPLDEMLVRGSFAAVPCSWTPDEFNAGILAIEPSQQLFDDMVTKIADTPSHDGSDQGFLNRYFEGWFEGPPIARLPQIFNASQYIYLYHAPWHKILDDMRILHFTGDKPWKLRTKIGLAIQKLWIQRFTHAAKTGDSPFQIYYKLRREMEAKLKA